MQTTRFLSIAGLGISLLVGCTQLPQNSSKHNKQTSLLKTDIAIEHFKNRDLAGSMQALTEALQKNPGNALAWMMLGVTYQADGNPDNQSKAREAFNKAVQLDPTNAQIHNNYGQFLAKQNQHAAAAQEFAIAANMISYTARDNAYTNWGYALIELAMQGDPTARIKAIAAFNKALAITPNYPAALAGLSKVQPSE